MLVMKVPSEKVIGGYPNAEQLETTIVVFGGLESSGHGVYGRCIHFQPIPSSATSTCCCGVRCILLTGHAA